MSKNTAPAKTATVTLKDAAHAAQIIPDGLTAATLSAFTESTATHRRRADVVRRLKSTGLSIRGIVAAVTANAGGAVPPAFSVATVGRYAAVVDAVADAHLMGLVKNSAPVKADVDDLIATLYAIACKPGKGNLAAAVKSWQDADSFAVATVRASAVLGELNASAARAALAKPNRPVGGEASDGGKTPATADTADDTAPTPTATPAPVTPASLPARLDALTAELDGLTPDTLAPAVIDALTRMIESAERIVTATVAAELFAD